MARKKAGAPIIAFTTELNGIPNDALPEYEKELTKVAEARARKDGMEYVTFGDRRYKLTIFPTRVKKGNGSSYLVLRGNPAGPWAWLERGVPRHRVGTKRTVRRRDGRIVRSLNTPHGPRIYAHASFPKRGSWSRFIDEADLTAGKVVLGTYDKEIRKVTS